MAGEHLVCSFLMEAGYSATLSERSSSFDILIEINGRFLKVEVKTARKLIKSSACFSIREENYQADIFAFVCLREKLIAFVKKDKLRTVGTFSIPLKKAGKINMIDYSFEKLLKEIAA